ncbi:hypothetical protein ANO11243_071220 [Dothideomycetidae sp. 11243]|nr:hypothetical protein ANO11243_071220 [fungal sp. No.11243]
MEYTNLGLSGLKVSKLVLGTMGFGDPELQPWVLDEEHTLPILKHAYDQGITTWDTANLYCHGESERIIGKAIQKYSLRRESLVIMSKCYFGVQDRAADAARHDAPTTVNRSGLSRKHILDAVEASVARLGTYIDVLQIHRLDLDTPAEEIMRALNDVVDRGWVRYLGACSMSTWQFQHLQHVAEQRGWPRFISMQGHHALLYREEEREMIPYCRFSGVGFMSWAPLAKGVLARPWTHRNSHRELNDRHVASRRTGERDTDKAIVDRVEEIAQKHGVSMACVATAWTMASGDIPIVGLASIDRIDEAVANAKFRLPEDDVKYLEELYLPVAVTSHDVVKVWRSR